MCYNSISLWYFNTGVLKKNLKNRSFGVAERIRQQAIILPACGFSVFVHPRTLFQSAKTPLCIRSGVILLHYYTWKYQESNAEHKGRGIPTRLRRRRRLRYMHGSRNLYEYPRCEAIICVKPLHILKTDLKYNDIYTGTTHSIDVFIVRQRGGDLHAILSTAHALKEKYCVHGNKWNEYVTFMESWV